MVINVSDILKEAGLKREINTSIALEDSKWQGEPLKFREPLSVKGNLTNRGNVIILNLTVQGTVIMQCGLCLGNFEQNLDFTFEARLINSPGSDIENDIDVFLYEGNEIDLSEILWEFLLLEIPIRRTCKEDCKGLCSQCGTNLNQKTCQCDNAEENDPDLALDERLQILKDHFSTRGKEV